jgi:iron complex outermembrane receptor protein
MNKKHPLSLSVKCVTLGIATWLLGSVASVQAQSTPTADENIEETLVTGSRIKRSDYQNGGQVVQIERQQIDALGSLTIADVLRSSPLNSFGSFSERSGSSAQSNATINLRGLEDFRTLVMLDGRRMVGSPNLGASTTNINMVPMAAVESVEVLADGASAVYGSDAVAGVVNMHLRENFDGVEFKIRGGDRSRDDGSELSASLLAGVDGENSNLTFAIEKVHAILFLIAIAVTPRPKPVTLTAMV